MMSKVYRWGAVMGLLLMTLSGVLAPTAQAATTLCVNPSGSDGCYSSITGAVQAAADGDTIQVAAGTYPEADITLTKSLTITGAGATTTTLDASGAGRGFVINSGVSVTISGLTVRGGAIGGSNYGGGISNAGTLTLTSVTVSGNSAAGRLSAGGGIFNQGTLRVINSTISDNRAAGASGGGIFTYGGSLEVTGSTVSGNAATDGGQGGGIYSYSATVTLTDSTFRENTATYGGGGIFTYGSNLSLTNSTLSGNTASTGGGIDTYNGTLRVNNTTVTGNTAWMGGGLYNDRGSLEVTGSTVSGNTARQFGGGIFTSYSLAAVANSTLSSNTATRGGGIYSEWYGTLRVSNTTVTGNTASDRGGGIHNSLATLELTNSTVSGNTAVVQGGGINSGTDTEQTAVLVNSTVSGNRAPSGGGLFASSAIALSNTIVANSPDGGDCVGPVTSRGHNLASDNSCALSGTGDLPSTDPQLGSLADNGGPTQTHALQAGSSAIDAGDDTVCPTTDQRGIARPQGAHCDIGAFEVNPDAIPPTTTATPSGTEGNAGWYLSDVTLTLEATDNPDGSGIDSTSYSVDDGPTQVYSAPFLVEGDGNHTITYSSTDRAGNVEPVQTLTIKIDKTAPRISISSPVARTYLLNEPVAAGYDCTDLLANGTTEGSGVDTCSGTVATGSNIDTAAVGTKTFTVNATDKAGNRSDPASVNYSVAYRINLLSSTYTVGPPSILLQLEDYSGNNVSSSDIPVTALRIVDSSENTVKVLNSPFTYTSTGQMYVYKISTKGLTRGVEYKLLFKAGNDPSIYEAPFTP